MKLIKLTIILLLAISMMHCSKSEEKVTMHYNQTQCADPWLAHQEGNSDEELIAAVRTYFETNHQIELKIIRISNSVILGSCFACDCLTYRVISVNVVEQFSNELEAEGFFIP